MPRSVLGHKRSQDLVTFLDDDVTILSFEVQARYISGIGQTINQTSTTGERVSDIFTYTV